MTILVATSNTAKIDFARNNNVSIIIFEDLDNIISSSSSSSSSSYNSNIHVVVAVVVVAVVAVATIATYM